MTTSNRAAPLAALLALTIVLAACDTASPSTIGSTTTPSVNLTATSLRTEPGGASDDPTTTTVIQTTTTEPEPASPFVGSDAVVLGPNGDGWNDNFVVPGPVIEDDGVLYMFYVGHTFTSPNLERGRVGVATSADGLDWAVLNPDPLFDGSDLDWTDAAVYPSSGMVMDDGTWVLWFSTVPRGFSLRAGKIGRATAPGPDGPWTLDPDPILGPGGEGTWYEKGVGHPSVVFVDGEYRMYFDGHVDDLDSTADRAISFMTSDDAVAWELYDDPETDGIYEGSDPVFFPGEEGSWDAARVMTPTVIALDDQWLMTYMSTWRRTDRPGFLPDLGYATSSDGISWQRADTNPLLDNTGAVSFITSTIAADHDGAVYLYYDIYGNAAASASYLVAKVAPIGSL